MIRARNSFNCLISLFYIKPQHRAHRFACMDIVLYLYSTSNHNLRATDSVITLIVLYLYSTSNHNRCIFLRTSDNIVLYLYSTSNHNLDELVEDVEIIVLYLYSTSNHNAPCSRPVSAGIVLYLYSTSNHNWCCRSREPGRLSYISILHQTTTQVAFMVKLLHCLISLFYIKPQRK